MLHQDLQSLFQYVVNNECINLFLVCTMNGGIFGMDKHNIFGNNLCLCMVNNEYVAKFVLMLFHLFY
jgi:hypothetical protein